MHNRLSIVKYLNKESLLKVNLIRKSSEIKKDTRSGMTSFRNMIPSG